MKHLQLVFIFIVIQIPNILQSQWLQTNGPFGADIGSMICLDTGKVLVWTRPFNGMTEGTLSYSHDAGKNWEKMKTPGGAILQLFRTSKGKLIMGTNAALLCLNSLASEWTDISDSLPFSTNHINLISEANNSLYIVLNKNGLYRSFDDGASWNLLNTNDTLSTLKFIVSSASGVLMAGGQYGVFSSNDSGRSWVLKNTGLELTNRIVVSMAMDNNGMLYVSFNIGGLYSSTDLGTTWNKKGTFGFFDDFIINQSDGKFIAGYGGRVIVSNDSGANWSLVPGKNLGKDIRHVAVDAGGILYGGSSRGTVYSSTDMGETWHTDGLSNKYIGIMTVGSNGTIYAGSTDYGLCISADKGNHWQGIDAGLPSPINLYSLMTVSNMYIFACTESGLYRSKQDTIQWEKMMNGLPVVGITSAISFHDSILIVGTKQGLIYRSMNSGKTWSKIAALANAILDIYSDDSGKIFASGNGGFFRSTNNGETWTWIGMTSLLEGGVVSTMSVAPNKTIFVSGMDAVLRSTDDGNTWTRILGKDGVFISIDALKVTNTGAVYAAWDSVYCSRDNGETWEGANDGLWKWIAPYCFSNSSDGMLYAGTWYGVFNTQSKVMGVPAVNRTGTPTQFSLYQNFPNPFNPTTTISFAIPVKAFVSLKIYDLQGKEIETLINHEMVSGDYSVQWNASKYPSGIYFYRLYTGSFTETKKIVFLK